jgi:hypothetical protein
MLTSRYSRQTRATLQWYSTLLYLIRRLVPSYRTQLTEGWPRTSRRWICKRLIPRVQNPWGHADSSRFVKRRSLLGRMSRRHAAASVERWPHTTLRVLTCHQGRSQALSVLWRPTWVWGLWMNKAWGWPCVHNNTGHNKKFHSLYCSSYIIVTSE